MTMQNKRPCSMLVEPIKALLAELELARAGNLTEAQDIALASLELSLERVLRESVECLADADNVS